MSVFIKVPVLGLGLMAMTSLAATTSSLKNPGFWKSLPYSLVAGEEEGTVKALRLKNNDIFDKACHVQVARRIAQAQTTEESNAATPPPSPRRKKLRLFYDDTIVIKADRAIEIGLGGSLQSLTLPEIVANAGCVHLPEGKKLSEVEFPADSSCAVNKSSCQQVCPASAEDPDKCANDHLVVAFDRKTWQASWDEDKGVTMSASFTNEAKSDLYCQVVTIVKGINESSGDVVYVTAPAAPKLFKIGEATTVEWGLEKTELLNSNNIDATRPRIVAACSEEEIANDFWSSCDPLKRSECNWIVAH